MHFSKSLILVALSTLVSCSHTTSFDREAWLANPEMTDAHNPRARMVQDVIDKHLKSGMTRKSVLTLLGQPYEEGIERRLPKNTILPDAISTINPENLRPENAEKSVAEVNNFYRLHAKPVKIMRYPVGWSTIDPNFLIIKLDTSELVEDYWIEQG